jgi:hypothetical protein
MSRPAILAALLAGLLAAPGRAQPNAGPITCKGDSAACIQSMMAAHPIRSPAWWADWRSKPLDERIAMGPPELVSYLRLDVLANRIPLTPYASTADEDMLDELRQAMLDLPANIRRMLDRQLLGLFLVNDFGGTGISDAIRWDRREGAGFIVLDPKVLRRRIANESRPSFPATAKTCASARCSTSCCTRSPMCWPHATVCIPPGRGFRCRWLRDAIPFSICRGAGMRR